MEAQVFGVNLLGAKFANIIGSVYFVTASLHARDFEHTALGDSNLEMVLNTVFALQVITRKAEHFASWILSAVNRALHHILIFRYRFSRLFEIFN